MSPSPRPARWSAPSASQRWRRLIPVVFLTYTFAYLDRSNYSLGAAGGLKDDLPAGWIDETEAGFVLFALFAVT